MGGGLEKEGRAGDAGVGGVLEKEGRWRRRSGAGRETGRIAPL